MWVFFILEPVRLLGACKPGSRARMDSRTGGGSTALHTAYIVDSVDTVCTFETVLHCLNSSRYAYRYVLLYRTLFESANELLSKKLEWSGWVMDWMYTP